MDKRKTTPTDEESRAIPYQSLDTMKQEPPTPPHTRVLWIVVGTALLALIIAFAAAYTLMFYVSRDDYKRAANDARGFTDAIDTMTPVRDSLAKSSQTRSVSDEDYKKTYDQYLQLLDEYQSKVDAMRELRVQKDGEAARLYSSFRTKNDEFIQFERSMAESTVAIREVAKNCDRNALTARMADNPQATQTVSSYDAMFGNCDRAVSAITKAPNASIAEAGKAVADYFAQMRKAVVDMQSSTIIGDRAAYNEASERFQRTQSGQVIVDVLARIDYRGDAHRPTAQLNELKSYLNARAK